MSDGLSIIPTDPDHPDHPDNLARRLKESQKSAFDPGKPEDYLCMPNPRDPSHPDFDVSFDNWQDYFTEMIQGSKGRYLLVSTPRLGMRIGRVDIPKSNEGEFIFQTDERIFYSIEYKEIEGLFVRR